MKVYVVITAVRDGSELVSQEVSLITPSSEKAEAFAATHVPAEYAGDDYYYTQNWVEEHTLED